MVPGTFEKTLQTATWARAAGLPILFLTARDSVEDRVAEIRSRMEKGLATEEDRAQLFKDLDTLQGLVAADEERRADGAFLSQMTGLQKAFLEDIAAVYEKAKRS